MKSYFLILLSFLFGQLQAQTDFYDQLKKDYERFRKEEKYDSALVVAKQMNDWSLKNETDTSLRYAVSLRYLGNCYSSIENSDSAIYYFNFSLKILNHQNRNMHSTYASSLNSLGILYRNMGDYNAAEPLYKQALEIKKKTLGEVHPDYAKSLNSLGILYSEMGDYKSAEPYYKQALGIRKKALGEEHPDYVTSLNNLGLLYSDMVDYKAAEPFLKQALEIRKKTLGEEHPDYTESLNNLGDLYSNLGNYKASEPYYKQSLEFNKRVVGAEHPDYASSLNKIGTLYCYMGDFKSAEPYLLQALEIRKKVLGELHPDYANSLNNLGVLYSNIGDYKSAESYYKQSLEISKKALGEAHPDYARSLTNLGVWYSNMGDYKAAATYFKQSLDISKIALGEEHPDYAWYLTNLGLLYSDMGDYKAAEPFLKQTLEIRKNTLGEEHPDYASSLNYLGDLYSDIGDYKAAEPFLKQALEIRKKTLSEEHPNYASSLRNLGYLYFIMGDYKAAEPLYKQALEIKKKTLGEVHPDYASSLRNLGHLYFIMGDYKAAATYCNQALEIYKNAFGEEHPDYATSLNDLGVLYSNMGDYKAAATYFNQALEISKKALGEEHPDYAASLINLGSVYDYMGDYKAAEPYYKQSLEIIKKALCEAHPDYASSLNNLGVLYSNMGVYKAAATYFNQALEIYRIAFGEEHPDYAWNLTNLGDLYSDMGDYTGAEPFYRQTLKFKINKLQNSFTWLSAQEKQSYWQQEKDFYDNMNSFSISAVNSVPSSTELTYNADLISKSLLLETSRELDHVIAQSSDFEMKAQFAEMKQMRRAHNKMQSEGSDKKDIMERYNAQADSLNKILVNKLGEYAASKRKFEITWKDIQSNITSTEASIEFARYYDDKDSAYKYLALVVRPGYDYPKLVKLGKEEDIRTANQPKGQDFATLYDLVWRGVDSLLTGVNTVYYSPAGELNNLAFYALCFEAGDSLVSSMTAQNRGVVIKMEGDSSRSCKAVLMDKYTLHQITTTRYLADGTLKKERLLNSSITLLGGINYNDLPANVKDVEHDESEQDFALNINLTSRNNEKKGNRSSSSIGKPMIYLEGTRDEVKHIATQLNGTWSVQTLSDGNASEHSLKSQMEKTSPGVLHIATHGFAFPDEIKKESKLMEMNQTSTYKVSEDPMVRCGLMLSGSNISWTGNPKKMIEQTGDDGILTAAEVANLDLSNTKLVVLSACETGLGKIEGSEGTFGLKRGFKLAGVEQMIVSLWSVPDKETMELMTFFYTDLTKTLNPVISFEKAQKEMRNSYPTQPDKWAGFVLVR